MRVRNLRTEYLTDPLGIDVPNPRLEWQLESEERGHAQTGYHILAASSPDLLDRGIGDLWDSGQVAGSETHQIEYRGIPLKSRQQVWWKVRVCNRAKQWSAWSESAHWSMGLLEPEDWTAEWISVRDDSPVWASRSELQLPPARYYRRSFATRPAIQRATLYATALGVFDLHLNGQRIDEDYLAPGWTNYAQRLCYRTHDVTALLHEGANRIGAVVADGWYAGYVAFGLHAGMGPNGSGRNIYGKTPSLLAQLEIDYADGTRETIGTDTEWMVNSNGPVRQADILMGETFDARAEQKDWCLPQAEEVSEEWESAIRAGENGSIKAPFIDGRGDREVELGFQPPARLQSYPAQPIRAVEEIAVQKITEPAPGTFVFDFGQNFAGVVRLRVAGKAGTKLVLRHGEMLYPDGSLMTENLRRALAIDTYILRGEVGGEEWSPRFTYHGFQYVEITGLSETPEPDMLTGLVLHSDTPLTSQFACSDAALTRFWKNTQWTQRANFIDVPTDCPQRDERLGWMGDAQIYVRTATYNADVAAFFTKWLDDVVEAQCDSGAYRDFCPYPIAIMKSGITWGTAWTDAGIICPWTMWQVYGDTRLVEKHWESMTRFMDWRQERAPDFRGRKDGNTWGDWLHVNDPTPIEFIDVCYFAHTARLMSEMAGAVGKPEEAMHYGQLHQKITTLFTQDYLAPDSQLKVESQTAHVLALEFDMVPAVAAEELAAHLAQKIEANEFRMSTGFLGTKPLLPVLTRHGWHDLACRLYQSRRFPSWGYEVEQGATSVWERWDSYTREYGFEGVSGKKNNASMNSFSHYAFGAVNEWVFRSLAGIDTDGPGYRRILIHPRPPSTGSNPDIEPVNWVKAEYQSPNGRILSQWKVEGKQFALDVRIPANTTAKVSIPAASIDSVTEGGCKISGLKEVRFLESAADCVELEIGSGSYQFASTLPSVDSSSAGGA
ncbi:family 78 glycoside hydrolase catalytic domain [Puniceicoccus vermicola]|uniref:alpha-L-rhamnosidase n=1 Tax=Puniceicoccus vermicola TaxID=388746 RepID=A0A7X1B0E3_9BACT|nr:family 78 glycoside hydrolase catalytic domain [Puniceicoccus vermicola]MBC2603242.1 family 78 glycoside hydrolase catalytic domain [Puniceicoccus vermicola]